MMNTRFSVTVDSFVIEQRLIYLLQQLTSELSSALTPEQVAEVIVDKGVAAVEGHLATVYVLTDEGKTMELLNKKGIPQESLARFQRFAFGYPGPLTDCINEKQAIYIESQEDYIARYPILEEHIRRNGTQATVGLPLIANARVLGAFVISFPYTKRFTAEEIAFMDALAQQTAQALERAYLYDAEYRANQRLAFLSDASKILTQSLHYQETLENISQLAVPSLAEWYHVDILEAGRVKRVAAKHMDPAKIEYLYELNRRYPADPNAITGAGKAMRTGQSEVIPQMAEGVLRRYAQDEGHWELLQHFDTGSVMFVPLTARGRTFGAITFAFSQASGRRFTKVDLEMAEELGRRAAVAIDNARLYEEMQKAVERTTMLQQFTASFSQALTPEAVANVVTQGLGAIGARAAVVMMLNPEKTLLQMIGIHNVNPSLQQLYQTIPVDADTMVSDAVRDNQTVWIHDLEEYEARYPHQVERSRQVGTRAAAVIPLIAEGRTIGALGISFAKEQLFTEEDRALIVALAQQCGQALERARLYGEAQELAAINERQRLARDLHDAVSQTLFSSTTIAQTLPVLWERKPERAAEQTAKVVMLNQAAMAEMRTLLLELRPEAIINTRLDTLLQQLTHAAKGQRLIETQADIDLTLPADVHVAFYRIAQESIHNILKHTKATEMVITLKKQDDQLMLCIEDNGAGFDTTASTAGLGLNSMRERAASIGAELEIESAADKGTTIRLVWGKVS
jgi:signal transduction histidine kinase